MEKHISGSQIQNLLELIRDHEALYARSILNNKTLDEIKPLRYKLDKLKAELKRKEKIFAHKH